MGSRRLVARRLAMIAAAALATATLPLGGAVAAGCGSTGGQRISLGTRVVATEGVAAPIENEYGWSITLTAARVSIGELYYFSGAPVVASRGGQPRSRPRAGPLLKGLWAIPSAHAHPGHYTEGDALGQMLEPRTVDLLVESALANAEAVTGRYESARFSFASPPQGELAGEMDGHVVWVEGEATKGGAVVRFRAAADEADVLTSDEEPVVEGCVFEAADIEASGTVTLTIHPGVWFDQVDFGKVEGAADADRVDLVPGEAPHKAFVRGLKKGTGYTFSYAP